MIAAELPRRTLSLVTAVATAVALGIVAGPAATANVGAALPSLRQAFDNIGITAAQAATAGN